MRLAPRFSVAAVSHVGRRQNNEDFHRVLRLEVPQGNLLLLAVADGMGGLEAGEWASKVAIEALSEAVRAYAEHLRTGRPAVGLPKVMEKAFTLAQRRVEKEAEKPGRKGMGTTLTAFLYADWLKEGVVGHIGDSRAYLMGLGGLKRLTEDHSWVAERLKEGVLTSTEAERHPYRHVLTRALGLPEARFDLVPVRLAPGEGVLLATDGLYGLVPEEEWVLGKDLQGSLEALLAEALRRGGDDNVTAVALRVE
ncbi:serine/threonine protein phosphatase [Thermus sp. 2.9]|uniref:PP2C family protein-serine/threonine phosphatase n=1 Tax=Thermus TaxID=270 RepID=UPI00054400A8|nr:MULTISPECIES: protein phosphatase 2C domain-containing protein [Thermus]KHG65279.1 serine/threonine protein phosphatase [Thermus sp. 2.9]